MAWLYPLMGFFLTEDMQTLLRSRQIYKKYAQYAEPNKNLFSDF